jgi:hypothetical protein
LPLREDYSPAETAELNRLLDALPVAIRLACGLLRETSVRDPGYLAADLEVSKILTRINQLMSGKRDDANVKT